MVKVVVVLMMLLVSLGFGLISPDLQARLATAAMDARLPVQIVLKRQFDVEELNALVSGLPRRERRVLVARTLQDFAQREQAGLLEYLKEKERVGLVADIRTMWIVNAVYCEATPAVIREVAQRAEVHYVEYDLVHCPDLLVKPREVGSGGYEVTWGVQKIRAPEVWTQGYTGQGVVCGHIDTGCDYTHPDLADHMWEDPNYPRHGWNFENNNNDPMDVQGHGTHTAGTVASDGTSGSQCGVAPDARIMVCRVRTVADSVAESQCWQAMQFVVSPPLSPENGADLYTMSLGWQISWNPRQATWRQVADNVNAAGVIQIIAAGNERYLNPPNSLRCPGNVPPPWWNPQNSGQGALSGVISIGATDSLDAIASFSSRGPVTWQNVAPYNDYPYPPGLTKPDVSAPGVAVKSCRVGGGYVEMDGTSMATPHTAGVACLMLSKNPNLSPMVVDSILEVTAVDLGTPGKDNDFGAGRIDALVAVNHITGSGGPMLFLRNMVVHDSPPGGNNNGRVDPGEQARLRITLRNSGGAACNNTVGVFRAFDSRLTVTDSLGSWGNIPAGEERTNTTDPIGVMAQGTIPPGSNIACTLFVSGDSADYQTKIAIALRVGEPPPQPGTVIWGPKVCPGMPSDWGLYGVAYNRQDNLIYCVYFFGTALYKYTSDSSLQSQGTVPIPEDSCTDIYYCSYDNTFWLIANPPKRVYKITPTGSVIRYFTVPQAEYPCGVAEDEERHLVYVSDRRSTTNQQRIFVYDTIGNILDTIIHPVAGYYGTRCLSMDHRSPSNTPSILNMYTWFDASGTALDSCAMLEIDRVNGTLRNRFRFTNTEWNMRGIEYDPRDGSYWVTIMQYSSGSNNMILKVVGFNMGAVGLAEDYRSLPEQLGWLKTSAKPNPATGRTVLSVSVPQPGNVDLQIFDNAGRLVRDLVRTKFVTTQAEFVWDGRDDYGNEVARGVYFYRVKSANCEQLGKVVLTR